METINIGAYIMFGTLLLIIIGSVIYLERTEFNKKRPAH